MCPYTGRRVRTSADARVRTHAGAPGPPLSVRRATVPDMVEDDLGRWERDVLALERRSWPSPGAKERAVREELGMAPVRYYQLLNALLDDPRALAHDPVTVNRLRRVRRARRAER